MGFYEEFAYKFFKEAEKDIERAIKSYNDGDYPDSVFHSQQCVEKAVKAMIESKREYVYNHGPALASIFVKVFQDEWEESFDKLVDIIGWFTEYYTRSRYPFLLKGRIVTPHEFIDRGTCLEAIDKAKEVLSIAEKYLRKRNIL